ncbi:hypothetical protein PCLA_05f0149 [Pseudomonas citronellolis]|nr:hypothetical protein PCLA_05f0149 [Pseudomonas citronellolis]
MSHCGYLCGFVVVPGKFSRSAADSWPGAVGQQLTALPNSLVPW